MSTVKVSSKYQIVIPKAVRERLHIKPGQEIGVIEKGGIAHLVPLKSIEELQQTFTGMDYTGYRDKSDRF